MKVTNKASFPVKAFGFHDKYGFGDDVYINPGESAEVKGPSLGETEGNLRHVHVPGEIICHEGDDKDNGFFNIGYDAPIYLDIYLDMDNVGIAVWYHFDDTTNYLH